MSGFSAIDLAQLPSPNIIESIDFEAILQQMLADLISRDATFSAFTESDPVYKVLEVAAYREMLLRARINDTAKGVMLAYAVDADLEVERAEVLVEIPRDVVFRVHDVLRCLVRGRIA